MVPICLCSSYFYGHGKIFFQLFWNLLCRWLITLLYSAIFSKVDITLNGCKNVSEILRSCCFYVFPGSIEGTLRKWDKWENLFF